MRLAKNALIVALTVLTFVFAVSAQTLRSNDDPRNTAPTVGTGGPVGGPTGLFTIYDGQTLRKGEYTFSAAYSNFDRDPGNVDITEIPVSFQIGLSDNLELFFNTDAYRQIKVNNPQNLSSFYLPNSQLRIAALGGALAVPGAIVLAPQGANATALANTAVYRRAGAPFVGFPFVGGQFGNNGFVNVNGFGTATIGGAFGFGTGNATYGAPIASGNGAANFPGLGSVYGSILPGIVLSTQVITLAPGTTNITTTVPSVFTVAPSYLPDAPFINRTYGQTAFGTYTAGAKYRFTNVESAFGLSMVGFYRWYGDKANSDGSGFNQLQRGASPGGNRGDFGVSLIADSRLRPWLNVSGNVGYILNSDVKGEFPTGDFTILDRPDELQYGVGLDFPINQFFQPILEFRGTRYVAGRTPNAFENHPQDAIGGIRIYPRRWFGFGIAYRAHLNQQDADSVDGTTNTQNANVVRITTNTAGVITGTTSSQASTTALSNVFVPSTDPHGYIFQAWVGRRNVRGGAKIPNVPANVTDVALDSTRVVIPCPPGTISTSSCTDDQTVAVRTAAVDPDNDVLTYNYTVSGGRIVGQGANVNWDLSGVRAGTYTITSAVDDGCGFCGKTVTKTVTVEQCPGCAPPIVPCACPTLSVSGPSDTVNAGQTMTFTANVSGGSQNSQTYNWTVSAGTITSGQGTPAITVDTTGLAGQSVTATVDIGGLCADCNRTSSATGSVNPPGVVLSRKVTEFGDVKADVIKAQLDNFFIELNNDPSAQGYVINYGTAKQKAARIKALNAAIAFRKYDKSRLVFVDGGEGEFKTEFWITPAGATPPTPGQ